MALIDESGVVKLGDDSVGVAHQYCGSVGKVANSKVGVYLDYVSSRGYTLADAHLFMHEELFDDAHDERCRKCGGPKDLIFKTKPEIALELLQDAVRHGHLPFQGYLPIGGLGIRSAQRNALAD